MSAPQIHRQRETARRERAAARQQARQQKTAARAAFGGKR